MVIELEEPQAGQENEEEGKDGAGNEEDPKNQDFGHQPGEESDPNAGGEGEEDGKGAGSDEGEGEPQIDQRDQTIADLQSKISALEGKVNQSPTPPPAPLSDEQKANISRQFGEMPFEQVEAITNYMASVISKQIAGLKEEFAGNFGSSQKESAISALAQEKEFRDVRSYLPGINEFLKKFNPKHHGNRDILMDAYYWSKGRGAGKMVQRIQNSQEKNRRIARPVSGGEGSGGRNGENRMSYKLTPSEEQAWETYGNGLFSSKEEYAKSLSRFNKK